MAPLSDEVAGNVRRQVEFYFSDSNLPNDKFLLDTIKNSPDGLVSLKVICAFTRMKTHLGLDASVTPETVTEEVATSVGEALRSCSLLKVSEDGLKVGRVNPIAGREEILAAVKARTRAVLPLPLREKRENVENFFRGVTPKVLSLRMPRHPKSQTVFSGCALVEFSSVEEAERVSGLELTFNGVLLEFQSKDEYDQYVEANKEARIIKGVIVKFTLEKRKVDETKSEGETEKNVDGETEKKVDGETEKKAECDAETKADGEAENDGEDEKADKKTGIDKNLISREDIKAVVQQYGSVRFIEYTRGGTSGYIRFDLSEGAEKARTAAVIADEGGLIVKDHIMLLEALQGEAEVAYWDTIHENQSKRKEPFQRGTKRPWGKRQFEKKEGTADAEPAAKVQRTE